MSRGAVASGERVRRWPAHGWAGLALVAVFWSVNWGLADQAAGRVVTHWAFFPLWLGYCLTVDALVCWRRGHSLGTRSPRAFAALFFMSAPAWWLFELLNLRVQNWRYLGRDVFAGWQYALLATFSFSTVMPAVFGTAELASTWGWIRRLPRGPKLAPTRRVAWGMAALGAVTLALLLAWPRYFFPLLWISVYCWLEPLNLALGNRTLLDDTARGDWRPLVSLSIGCLVCGFFWEMWNYYSYPKWVYDIPFVDFWRVFEMPLLGYGGYIVFAWELHALHQLLAGPFVRGREPLVRLAD